MRMQLCHFIPVTLAERGTMSWEALLLLHCADWTSEKFVRSIVAKLLRDGAIVKVEIQGCTFFKVAPLDQQTEAVRTAMANDELQDDIVALLAKGPASEELLRDRLTIASRTRFVRAMAGLVRNRIVSGHTGHYRLAQGALSKSFSNLEAVNRDRRAQVSA
jgi:hypothetical protein